MSHITYDNLWKQAQCSLDILKDREAALTNMKPQKDKNMVYQLLLKTFVEYVGIYQKLEVAYDQVIQPQKRLILRDLLGTSIIYNTRPWATSCAHRPTYYTINRRIRNRLQTTTMIYVFWKFRQITFSTIINRHNDLFENISRG